jgi:RNA polymerase sigma-70 factor (ECF subfamily)
MSETRRETEDETVTRLRHGEVDAIAAIYDLYGGLAFSVALRVLGDRQRAEDVTQEAFVNLWKHAGQFDQSRGSLRTWLLTIVRNRAIDALRGQGARDRAELPLIESHPAHSHGGAGGDPWQTVAAGLEAQAVREAIASLPAEQRQVVELAYYGGYTHQEIAKFVRLPLGTVKGRMRLALEKLHSYLVGRGLIGAS